MGIHKKKKAIVTLLLCLAVLLLMPAETVFADIAMADSGVDYEISDDGTYVIIIGYSGSSPNLRIEAEIEGLPVKEISASAFHSRTTLYSVIIPDSVEKIGEAAFRNCQSLVSVKLPAGLTELPFECFRDCKVLSSVELPETLRKIDDFCFQGCTKLGNVKIPASVTELGYDVFLNCESILLDCSENPYALEYAKRFNVNTDFEGTSVYFGLMMLAGTAFFAVIAVVIIILIRRHVQKHPEHDPGIYVSKFFSAIAHGFRFVFSKIRGALMYVIDGVFALIDRIDRKK